MAAYYNEFKPEAAHMLRHLIKDGLIADGEVDERSITEVKADELKGFTQCHFFAGIGGWSVALRQAGWADDRPVWTGSCPCQPFSAAGKHAGKEDERHLWPTWFNLIIQCRPSMCFGEQVSSAISHGWLDGVYSDMEAQDYAIGAAVLPAFSGNAPHRRDRLWFVASDNRSERIQGFGEVQIQGESSFSWRKDVRGFEDLRNRPNIPEPLVRKLSDGVCHGAPLLHAYGNAIVPEVASRFIQATM